MSEQGDGWSYKPHEGPHDFKPWTVIADHHGKPWLAPGCTCGVIRSAGPATESEEAMRLWWDSHAKRAGHARPNAHAATRDESAEARGGETP